MNSAAEIFVTELGRVSKRGSRYLRGLSRADREDVIATAILYCWEHRAELEANPQPLDTWFADRLKAARRNMRRERIPSEQLGELMAPEDTARIAEAEEILAGIARNLTDDQQKVAGLVASGYSMRSILRELPHLKHRDIKLMIRELRKLRDFLPDVPFWRPVVVNNPNEISDQLAPIDHQIEQLLRGPKNRYADCPPCWKCSWYSGVLPIARRFHLSQVIEPQIRAAVRSTEKRKIEIANTVRSRAVEFEFQEET